MKYSECPLNILISYAYWGHKELENYLEEKTKEGVNYRILIDSGAFTVWNAKKPPIKVDDYCRFLDRVLNKNINVWGYFTLDVVGDGEKTYSQYLQMKSLGFNPIPIFTASEDLSMIDEYYKHSDIVGFGGLGIPNDKYSYLKHIKDNYVKDRKCHFLGEASPLILYSLRPYSCDSSNLSSGSRFANIDIYNNYKMIKKTKPYFKNPHPEVIKKLKFYSPRNYRKLGQESAWKGSPTWATAYENIPIHAEIPFKSWIHFSMDYYKIGVNYWNALNDIAVPSLFNCHKELIENILVDN